MWECELSRGSVVGRVRRRFSSKRLDWVWSSPSLSFNGYWSGWSAKWTTHLQVVLRLQMDAAVRTLYSACTLSWRVQGKLYIYWGEDLLKGRRRLRAFVNTLMKLRVLSLGRTTCRIGIVWGCISHVWCKRCTILGLLAFCKHLLRHRNLETPCNEDNCG